jgi:monoamine oxidase
MNKSINSPTKAQRHEIYYEVLKNQNRPEDYENILNILSPPIDITNIAKPGSFKNINVGIIGGGASGLAAAFELRKLGFNITIFDALKDRVGGRIYTHYFDKDNKLYAELGAMRIPIGHETSWHYIDLFNLKTKPFVWSNENAIRYVKNMYAQNDPNGMSVMRNIYPFYNLTPRERATPWNILMNDFLNYYLFRLTPEERKELIQVKPYYSPNILYLDAIDLREAANRYGLSREAIFMLSSVNSLVGGVAYTNLLEFLQEQYTADFENVYQIEGGMVNLPLAFRKSLNSKYPREYNIDNNLLGNITFKDNHYVTRITQSKNNGPITLHYRYNQEEPMSCSTFDYVVCAIPFSSLRTIDVYPQFSTQKMQAIRDLNYETGHKTGILFRERFWEKNRMYGPICGGSSYTDLPIASLWYPSYDLDINCNENSYNPGVLWTYSYTLDALRLGNLPDKIRISIIKRNIEMVHNLPSGYLDKILINYKTVQWDKEFSFQGGFHYLAPNQKRLFSYVSTIPEYGGRVVFAGEHIAGTHAWIQGALKTGMEAANDIARFSKAHI